MTWDGSLYHKFRSGTSSLKSRKEVKRCIGCTVENRTREITQSNFQEKVKGGWLPSLTLNTTSNIDHASNAIDRWAGEDPGVGTHHRWSTNLKGRLLRRDSREFEGVGWRTEVNWCKPYHSKPIPSVVNYIINIKFIACINKCHCMHILI